MINLKYFSIIKFTTINSFIITIVVVVVTVKVFVNILIIFCTVLVILIIINATTKGSTITREFIIIVILINQIIIIIHFCFISLSFTTIVMEFLLSYLNNFILIKYQQFHFQHFMTFQNVLSPLHFIIFLDFIEISVLNFLVSSIIQFFILLIIFLQTQPTFFTFLFVKILVFIFQFLLGSVLTFHNFNFLISQLPSHQVK